MPFSSYSGSVGLIVPSSMPVQPASRRVRGVVATWLAVVGRVCPPPVYMSMYMSVCLLSL